MKWARDTACALEWVVMGFKRFKEDGYGERGEDEATTTGEIVGEYEVLLSRGV